MRRMIPIAAGALALAACHNTDQVENSATVDQNLSADDVATNDVTAIDAVTGADANMAADVNYTNLGATGETSNDSPPSTKSPATPEHKAPKPAPTANSSSTVAAPTNNAA